MKIFCQQNYPQKMGTSNYTIARYGCLDTVITVGYDWFFSESLTPPQIASKLSFNSDGMLIWGSLKNIGLGLKNRVYGRNDAIMLEAIKNPNEICAIQVNSSHWVLATSKSILGGYNIFDPWFGDLSTTRRYKNNISGCAIIIKL